MIVKITRGGQMRGLMRYLAGPGHANEHESPHLVAGSPGLLSWWSHDELNRDDADAIARHLEEPQRSHPEVAITTAVKIRDDQAGEWVTSDARRDAHVWHCSLSLHPDVEPLGDEKWGQIAEDFVAAMDFAGDTEGAGGKAACRWAAVHHGATANGGDHIHIAIDLVRVDGTKASTWNDYKRASKAVAEIEQKHGLEVVAGRAAGRSARPETRHELHQAKRTGATQTTSTRLEQRVRGAAAVAGSEAEFVRRCRDSDLLVRPRFASGTQDVVVGYSVAMRPPKGERPTWRGGGRLSKDLTLPRLRETWSDSPQGAAEAAAEWRAAWRGQPPVGPQPEGPTPDPAEWTRAVRGLEQMQAQLAQVQPGDHATWARIAHEASGTLAAWSRRTEAQPGPLAAASRELGMAAALHRREVKPPAVRDVSMRGPALLLAAAASGFDSRIAMALLVRQLGNTIREMHRAQVAAGHAREAARTATVLRERLTPVLRDLEAQLPQKTKPEQELGQTGGRPPASPLPTAVQQPTRSEVDRIRGRGAGRGPAAER